LKNTADSILREGFSKSVSEKPSGYRVISARMKGMTAQNPPECQDYTAKNTIFFNRPIGIGGTGRIIPATGGKIGRNRLLIKPDQKKRKLTYRRHYSSY
jgi:hypothetical protein